MIDYLQGHILLAYRKYLREFLGEELGQLAAMNLNLLDFLK